MLCVHMLCEALLSWHNLYQALVDTFKFLLILYIAEQSENLIVITNMDMNFHAITRSTLL